MCPSVSMQQRPDGLTPLDADLVLTYGPGNLTRFSWRGSCGYVVARVHGNSCDCVVVMLPASGGVTPTAMSCRRGPADRAGDMLALYEVMYLPGQVHIFTAFADTDCEVIKVERHVRTRQYRRRACTASNPKFRCSTRSLWQCCVERFSTARVSRPSAAMSCR